MSDLDSIKNALKKLSTAEREEVARLAGLDIGEEGSSTPLESIPDKFYWIPFLIAIIGPWVFLIWMLIDNIDMVLIGAASGIWSVYLIRGWLREYERREKLKAKMYGEEADDDGEDE